MEPVKTVLVTGATGRQGGATARELLAGGWRVRALVRDAAGEAAAALEKAGAELARGDLEEPATLATALAGAHGVFSVQNYWGKGIGYDGEIRQGRNLAEAAAEAGIRHFVQSSIVSCDAAPDVRHFTCKHEVEQIIDGLGLSRTFLRTVFFMDNFIDPKVGKWMLPVLAGSLQPELRLHMIAVADIGRVAAEAFRHPDHYLGRSVDLAGDALTVAEMKSAYVRATGRKASAWRMPRWLFRLMNADMAEQFAWNHSPGWTIDPEGMKAIGVAPTDFESFLRQHAA